MDFLSLRRLIEAGGLALGKIAREAGLHKSPIRCSHTASLGCLPLTPELQEKVFDGDFISYGSIGMSGKSKGVSTGAESPVDDRTVL